MLGGIDRRKFPRAEYPCVIHIKRKDGPRRIESFTENIGAGGVCVLLEEDLGLFQGVDTELILPGQTDPIKAPGTVVWVVKKRNSGKTNAEVFDTGIEFTGIDEKERQRIVDAVEIILKS